MTEVEPRQSRWRQLWSHPGFRRQPAAVVARAAVWAVHCGLGIPARVRFRRADFQLYLPPRWRGGGSTSVFLFREWYEPEFAVLQRLLRPGMVFVDGGANTGAFTFAAARLVGPRGKVVAFEPGRRCFAALRQSARLNGFDQVILRDEGLADRSGTARLYHHRGQDNCFALGPALLTEQMGQPASGVGFDLIHTTTLSAALDKLGVRQVDFLKLDIEGAQELALRGCLELLQRDHPHVLIENHALAARRLGLDPQGAFDLLSDRGYRFFRVADGGGCERLSSTAGVRSVLALHPDRRLDDSSDASGNVSSEWEGKRGDEMVPAGGTDCHA
ncbi:MAG: FkbM family methyltransferase [Pirellulaceae bacterium]|nr:FkbM family methyltransferase [Pirellulaceae bacterium]